MVINSSAFSQIFIVIFLISNLGKLVPNYELVPNYDFGLKSTND